MILYHVAGSCAACGERCFEVLAVHEDHERLPGEPKRLGEPRDDAIRATFLLMDGTKAMLTLCGVCAAGSIDEQFTEIWRRIIRTWQRELSEKPADERSPTWFPQQFSNGLLCELGRRPWKEAFRHG